MILFSATNSRFRFWLCISAALEKSRGKEILHLILCHCDIKSTEINSNNTYMLLMMKLRDYNHLVGRKNTCWKEAQKSFSRASDCLQPSCKFQHVTCALGPCVGLRQPMALIGNPKQATGDGKSGPVETGLTGSVATALVNK